MTEDNARPQASSRARLSEDWLAVIVGAALLASVFLGVLARVPW